MLWQKYKKISLDDLFYIFNKHHMIHFCPVKTNACLLIFIYSNKSNKVATASQNQIISTAFKKWQV